MKRPRPRTYAVSFVLFALTVLSTLWVGAQYVLSREPRTVGDWLTGAHFAVPLLAILVAHESGHFFAARRRGVRASPPYFLPVPFAALGTMGAVIGLARVRRRDAMLEIGAAGPLAGMVVALPVLAYGLSQSSIGAPPATPYLLEGKSLLYAAFVRLFAGPIPEGQDILLVPTAFAGWAGLLVTMANLVPIGQLDGGHVGRALFGEWHARAEPYVHGLLGTIGVLVSVRLGLAELLATGSIPAALESATGGLAWLVWAGMIALIGRLSPVEPAPVKVSPRSRRDARRMHRSRALTRCGAIYAARKARLRARNARAPLPRAHRLMGLLTLALFPLLFMPFWLRIVRP